MAGMRALGRVYDILAPGSGLDICLKDASGLGILATTTATAACSIALVAKPSFGGASTNVTPANGFGQPNTWFLRSVNGTVAWAAQTAVWTTNSLALGGTAGNVNYVDFLVSELADTFDYLNITATNCVVTAYLYDLTVARKPQNLRIPSA